MDQERLEALYREHGRMVFRRARAILGDTQAAHDAVQETFLRALGARAEFEDAVSPVAWLYKITTNHCLNHLRDARRRLELLAERAPERNEVTNPRGESLFEAGHLLRRLPRELGEIAVYYYIDQMNQDEIAELLGTSRRTVGYRLEEFRAAATALLSPTTKVSA
jgi:RNA polymerase sigma-70 factor (ECF subfamily)